jgi:hypothetical protein
MDSLVHSKAWKDSSVQLYFCGWEGQEMLEEN